MLKSGVGQGSGTCPSLLGHVPDPCPNSVGLISGFSVPESAKAVVEYLGAVVQPVAHDSNVLHNASAVAVHVGEQLIRHGRSFGAGRVLYRGD